MTVPVSTSSGLLVRFLRRGEPLRRLPVLARYAIAILIVLAALAIRYALGAAYPYPYLTFVLAVVLTSFILDRGSGFLATAFSAILAVYFFVEPRYSFALPDIGPVISIALFVAVGLLSASIIEVLRATVEELTIATEDLAASRKDLAENLGILETVIESTPDPIFVKDREGCYLRANTAAARLLGVPVSALAGRRTSDFLPADQAEQLEAMDRNVLELRAPITSEEEITTADAGKRWFLTTKAPWYGPQGTLAGIIKIARDIHERKLIEQQVREANAQKEILLHDINHRIKNHLQSIIATLGMSKRQIEDRRALEAVETAISRLSVLGRVYDRLELKPGGEAVVMADDFIGGLCRDLEPALIDLQSIVLNVQVERIPLEVGRAVSVGLIVNEALTNALKHGFPNDRAGQVLVTFEARDEELRLEISDDGDGVESQKSDPPSGIGMRLMRSLAQQLKGTLEIEGPPGTTVIVRFPDQASRS